MATVAKAALTMSEPQSSAHARTRHDQRTIAVTYRSADGIATITINRAERMNRMDAAVVEGLHQAWHRFMAARRTAWRC